MENKPLLKNNKEKIRNPNIDFIRIAGMFAIIVNHLLAHGRAYFIYTKYYQIHLLLIALMWHVSSFGLISGMVGIRTPKFSNLFYLWTMTVFYSVIFYIKYNKQCNLKNYNKFITNIFPVIYKKYWYFTAYFGLYPFLPFVNAGISVLPRIVIKKIIYFIIGIFIIWPANNKDVFYQNLGYNTFSLLISSIFGAYIGKYIFYQKKQIISKIIICTFCLVIFTTITLFTFAINKNIFPQIPQKIRLIFRTRINSFSMYIQVFAFTIFVAQIKFNQIISKIITFIGPLTFDVYLIHENPYIRDIYIKNYFNKYSINLKLSSVYFILFRKAFYIFNASIFIAYIRNIIFRIIYIRNISIKCEYLVTKIINYFI